MQHAIWLTYSISSTVPATGAAQQLQHALQSETSSLSQHCTEMQTPSDVSDT